MVVVAAAAKPQSILSPCIDGSIKQLYSASVCSARCWHEFACKLPAVVAAGAAVLVCGGAVVVVVVLGSAVVGLGTGVDVRAAVTGGGGGLQGKQVPIRSQAAVSYGEDQVNQLHHTVD